MYGMCTHLSIYFVIYVGDCMLSAPSDNALWYNIFLLTFAQFVAKCIYVQHFGRIGSGLGRCLCLDVGLLVLCNWLTLGLLCFALPHHKRLAFMHVHHRLRLGHPSANLNCVPSDMQIHIHIRRCTYTPLAMFVYLLGVVYANVLVCHMCHAVRMHDGYACCCCCCWRRCHVAASKYECSCMVLDCCPAGILMVDHIFCCCNMHAQYCALHCCCCCNSCCCQHCCCYCNF